MNVNDSFFTSYSQHNEWKSFNIYFDKDGYRIKSEKKLNKYSLNKIAFLGDSFTIASQVPYNKTFVGLLENSLPSSNLKNFATSSYSPSIYLVQVLNDFKKFKPTHVVIQIYDNDIKDDNEYIKLANSNDINNLKYIDGGGKNLMITLYRHSHFLRFIRKFQQIIKYKYFLKDIVPAYNFDFYKNIKNKNNLTNKIIKKINSLSTKQRFKLYYIYIPNKLFIKDNMCCHNVSNYKAFKEFIGDEKFIDISNYFSNPADKIYFNKDIHLTPYGHQLVAKAIKDRILSDLIK